MVENTFFVWNNWVMEWCPWPWKHKKLWMSALFQMMSHHQHFSSLIRESGLMWHNSTNVIEKKSIVWCYNGIPACSNSVPLSRGQLRGSRRFLLLNHLIQCHLFLEIEQKKWPKLHINKSFESHWSSKIFHPSQSLLTSMFIFVMYPDLNRDLCIHTYMYA